MLHSAEDVRRYALSAPSRPDNQDRVEVRIKSGIIAAVQLLMMCEPIFYLLTVQGSPLMRVAKLAPSPLLVLGLFIICILASLPHFVALCFAPGRLSEKWPRRFAACGAMAAAIGWLYLAVLASPLDYGGLPLAYVTRAFILFVIAGSYGFSVNAQQLREAASGVPAR